MRRGRVGAFAHGDAGATGGSQYVGGVVENVGVGRAGMRENFVGADLSRVLAKVHVKEQTSNVVWEHGAVYKPFASSVVHAGVNKRSAQAFSFYETVVDSKGFSSTRSRFAKRATCTIRAALEE